MYLNEQNKQEIQSGNAAVITDIEKFASHDGPGIRTMVFFKGCPLCCLWCQNPETWNPLPERMYFKTQCIGCGHCVAGCPNHALTLDTDGVHMEISKCVRCGRCAERCYAEAIKVSGRLMRLDEVFNEVLKDQMFYQTSGGGLTLSGGECTMHARFASRLLQKAQSHGIHTAIETCGFCQWDKFHQVIQFVDLILFDIKVPVPQKSRQYTGQDCGLILENIRRARALDKHIILRLPLIPGVNDDDATLRVIGDTARSNGIEELHILPFHQAGSNKWHALVRDYAFEAQRIPTDTEIIRVQETLSQYLPHVSVGGSAYQPEPISTTALRN